MATEKNQPVNYPPSNEAISIPQVHWYERLNVLNVTFIIFILAVIYSGSALHGSDRDLDYFSNLLRFANQFIPPDFSVLNQTFVSLLETVEIAVVATFFALFISFIFALCAAQNISPRWLVGITRMILNAIRTIPSLIWALIAVAIVGANPLAGVIALTFYSIGYLGKFFSEAFESSDIENAKALRSLGADPIQAFQYGLWPHAKPLIWSYSIWMLEYNIRSASIIGYVGAGGIGLQLYTYQEFHQWDKFATVLICILIIVSILDLLGEGIRRKIAKKVSRQPLAD